MSKSTQTIIYLSNCLDCGGDVILEEGSTLETIGYGYGTFVCQKCKKESSYYGEGLINKPIKYLLKRPYRWKLEEKRR